MPSVSKSFQPPCSSSSMLCHLHHKMMLAGIDEDGSEGRGKVALLVTVVMYVLPVTIPSRLPPPNNLRKTELAHGLEDALNSSPHVTKAYSPVKGSRPYTAPRSSITVCRSQYIVSSKTSCSCTGGSSFHASAEGEQLNTRQQYCTLTLTLSHS